MSITYYQPPHLTGSTLLATSRGPGRRYWVKHPDHMDFGPEDVAFYHYLDTLGCYRKEWPFDRGIWVQFDIDSNPTALGGNPFTGYGATLPRLTGGQYIKDEDIEYVLEQCQCEVRDFVGLNEIARSEGAAPPRLSRATVLFGEAPAVEESEDEDVPPSRFGFLLEDA